MRTAETPAIMVGRATSAKLAYYKGKYLGLSPVLFVDTEETHSPAPVKPAATARMASR